MEQLINEQSSYNDEVNGEGEEGEERPSNGAGEFFDFGRYITDIDDLSKGSYYGSSNIFDDLNNEISRNNNNQKTYLERISRPDRLSKSGFYSLVSQLNHKQREYLVHVVDHIRYNGNRTKIRMFSSDNERTFDPFFYFVTGNAGVGKSMLIKALYEALCIDRDLDMNTPSVLLRAPTGRAAFNIQGQTLHGAFQHTISQYGNGDFNRLSADVSHPMSASLKDLKVLIIDEFSMVGDIIFSGLIKD